MWPRQILELILQLESLSGVGSKTAQRYALEMISFSEEKREKLIKALTMIKEIRKCERCNYLSEEIVCKICLDEKRDDNLICVVSSIQDLIKIEDSSVYQGKYFILNGLISINKGIFPEQLNITQLLSNLKDGQEVILALSSSLDGVTTARYIEKLLANKNNKISMIASGVPVGSSLEYVDEITLSRALNDRRILKK